MKQSGSVRAKYAWTADGVKISAMNSSDGFEYFGNMVFAASYVGLEPESAAFPEGRITAQGAISAGGKFMPVFHLTDHLGSVRAELDPTTKDIKTENEYMPYGIRYSAKGYGEQSRYQFSGKESQTVGTLGLLDFGARMYDPVLCRWLTNDPLAEKYYNISPYVYAGANPLRYIDPDGKKLVDAKGNLMWENGKWTSYATQDVMKYGNLLMQTKTGKEQFDFMINHKSDFTFSIADKRTEGNAAFGENHALGVTVDSKTRQLKQVKRFHITLYTGEAEDNAALYGGLLTPDQAMAATFGHEIEHSKDDNLGLSIQQYYAKLEKDTKLANKLESDIEKKPNAIKAQIASEFSGINNTWQKVADAARRFQERLMREQFQKLLSK